MIAESEPDDEGKVRLRINPQNAGPAPRIYYAEDAPVTEASPQLKDQTLTTGALRVNFLVWTRPASTKPATRLRGPISLSYVTRLVEKGAKRSVELFVAPKGIVRYTLDGSEPRDGTTYDKAVEIGDGEVLLRVFAEADGLEAKEDFRFPAKGKKGVQIDDVKPAVSFPAPDASSIRARRPSRV